MKNLTNRLLILFAAGLFIFSSCDGLEDIVPEENAPTLSVTTTPADEDGVINAEVGQTVSLAISVDAPAGFNVIRITAEGFNTVEINRNDLELEAGATEAAATVELNYQNAGEFTINVQAVDDENQTDEVDFSVTVVDAIDAFSATLLYAPTENKDSKTFFSTSNGQVYSMNEVVNTTDPVSATIDFGYHYGPNSGPNLSAPDQYPFEYGQADWNVRNVTKLKKTNLTQSAFLEATSAQIESAFTNASFGTNEGRTTQLAAGEVLAFMTDGSKEGGAKYGLIYVNEIVGTDGSDAYISLEIIVQK